MNEAGTELIKRFEGFRPQPYRDLAGVVTIGYGTTRYPCKTPVTMADSPVTEKLASYYLVHHLNEDGIKIRRFIKENKLNLNDNQFSALMSFSYNLGVKKVIKEGSVCRSLKEKKYDEVPKAMKKYCKARVDGKLKKIQGLINRREAECELYLKQ